MANARKAPPPHRKRKHDGLSPERLLRVIVLIEERGKENLPVRDLAKAVNMSPFHFARMFRRSTGLPPHKYITQRRLERAKELLAATDRRMGEIAQEVGYRNQAHFTRVFRARIGLTPRRFRNSGGGSRHGKSPASA